MATSKKFDKLCIAFPPSLSKQMAQHADTTAGGVSCSTFISSIVTFTVISKGKPWTDTLFPSGFLVIVIFVIIPIWHVHMPGINACTI